MESDEVRKTKIIMKGVAAIVLIGVTAAGVLVENEGLQTLGLLGFIILIFID